MDRYSYDRTAVLKNYPLEHLDKVGSALITARVELGAAVRLLNEARPDWSSDLRRAVDLLEKTQSLVGRIRVRL
jgi:hypothetical protein